MDGAPVKGNKLTVAISRWVKRFLHFIVIFMFKITCNTIVM